MRIYVAGRFQSYKKCREVIDRLRALGHAITYDWTRTREFDSLGEPIEREIPKRELEEYAHLDLRGVMQAETLVLCADDSLAGAYIETGYALAFARQVIVVAPERSTIFYELPNVTQLSTYNALYEYLG